ncbi:MAG: branched-chain amino acid ABC transporter permease [Acidilobaceae archaeon]
MSLDIIARYALDTLFFASLLFLVVAGLNIVYGVLRIVNLAHASLFTLGAYLTAWFTASYVSKWFSQPIALLLFPLLVAAVVTAIVSLLLVMPILRYSYGKGDAFQLIVTFGLFMVFEELFLIVWGRAPLSATDAFFSLGTLALFGSPYPLYKIYVIAVTLLLALLLWFLTFRSHFGLMLRAISMDPEMTAALGADVMRFVVVAVALASLLAGVGGALYLPIASVAPGLSPEVLIVAFVGLVIGGMGSFLGSAIGALVVSVFRTLSIYFFPELELVILFAVALLVLLLRPEGIGGGKGW